MFPPQGAGTKTLNPANDTVAAGYYEATTLSAIDTDLAVGNIKSGVTIFGFLGTYAGTLSQDIVGDAFTALLTGNTVTCNLLRQSVAASGDVTVATLTQNYAANSMAVAVGYVYAFAGTANTLKVQLFMDGVMVAESIYIQSITGYNYELIATKALSGNKVCYVSIHNYDAGSARNVDIPGYVVNNKVAGMIAVGSVKGT
jgi:hypothetical protein